MKKYVAFIGIVIVLALCINTTSGLCEFYKGKAFPTDIITEMLKYQQGPAGTYIGKVEDGRGNYDVYFYYTKNGVVDRIRVIHLDTDMWVVMGNKNHILQKLK